MKGVLSALGARFDRLPPGVRRALPGALVAFILLAVFGYSFAYRMKHLFNPLNLADDARQQIVPFYRNFDPGTFLNDLCGDYFLSPMPIGFLSIYAPLSKVFDPAVLSKIVPTLLLIPLLWGLAVAAKRLAGLPGMLVTLFLALSCSLYVERMSGGLARSFGYPILALAIAALVTGRIRLLCVFICLGAAFYPTIIVPAGLALGILLFFYPAADRGEARDWRFRRRAAMVAGTALIAALIVLPSVLSSRKYGRSLAPIDVVEYPEIGLGGRYDPNDRIPFPTFSAGVPEQARRALKGEGPPLFRRLNAWATYESPASGIPRKDMILDAVLGLIALGSFFLLKKDEATRRLFALALASGVAYYLACILAPLLYLPFRYISYPVPEIVMVLLPAAGAALGREVRDRWRLADPRALAGPLGALVLSALCVLPFGSRLDSMTGVLSVSPKAQIYRFLAGLPKDILVAGWPRGVMDNVPYLARRQALITYECHQAFHKNYADEARRRTKALIAAYFAPDPAPLLRLRDELGVTHLVVDRDHFANLPTYFKPFDDDLRRAEQQAAGKGFEVLRQIEVAQVFTDGTLAVLDLRRLDPARGAAK